VQLQNKENFTAEAIERILREAVCKERLPGDRLSLEMLAEAQAKKDKKREEIMKKHSEWQKIKRS
jgi:hypothetical protein